MLREKKSFNILNILLEKNFYNYQSVRNPMNSDALFFHFLCLFTRISDAILLCGARNNNASNTILTIICFTRSRSDSLLLDEARGSRGRALRVLQVIARYSNFLISIPHKSSNEKERKRGTNMNHGRTARKRYVNHRARKIIRHGSKKLHH